MYQNPEPHDELLECFDEQGNVTSPRTRAEVHAQPLQYWHGVVNVWIISPDGRLLCSKRSELLQGNPGKWQSYFGGHLKVGQSFAQAAVAEMDEEIGLSIQVEKLRLIEKGTHEPSKHFYESFVCLFAGSLDELRFNDGEITEVQWMSFDAYNHDKEVYPDRWCNGISLENQQKIIALLTV